MSTPEIRYDADAQCVFFVLPKGERFEIDAARTLSKIARSGKWDGNTVRGAEVRFDETDTAQKHVDALGFLDIRAVTKDGALTAAPIRARQDFGL
ncbi:MAG: hypothetical protein ACI81R_000947 [Bradymonadia bacterium]|jgi:hypothetical protein